MNAGASSRYEIHPMTPDRWDDLLVLFGPGGVSSCWCTWWVLTNRDWEDAGAEGRREVLEAMVAAGEAPGLLAYLDGAPVGWVALGPRDRYARMMSPRSRAFRPLDERPSWVINCFYIARGHRGEGVATALMTAAVEHAFAHGAERIDGHPKDTSVKAVSNADLFVGSLKMFLAAGFTEVERRNGRPVVRLERSSPTSLAARR